MTCIVAIFFANCFESIKLDNWFLFGVINNFGLLGGSE